MMTKACRVFSEFSVLLVPQTFRSRLQCVLLRGHHPTMKTTTSDFPPKLQPFASLLDAQPPEVQEAFQFLLATAMHEAGKFEFLNVAEVGGRWHYTFSSAGEVFSVVRPEMSKDLERRVLAWRVKKEQGERFALF